ncbi:hypothetical protein FJ970_09085 [Mesorhizobium sp. B2-1-8]|uniref:hypothetical protein n=1 Tax=Mesorhizobium sp. B2-1-8 TaxID=2589967 RepID=UPI00112C1E32|nr:hypothetical protein [Mesorhizobium sp. B2-1-8]UCI21085.1 hypothetical protein FJ970_09085 [Mesorhizobium sp. B2-1-8]
MLTIAELMPVLEKLLGENPGPVSIVAGIAALRTAGDPSDAVELQAVIGTFAADRQRSFSIEDHPRGRNPRDWLG